ncbi:copper-binding protein [Acidovorax sp. SDU_ACID1]|uniref:copper-binding protein n=1 Tax=Acidovorax sp. SDU_ACID1 TaxID=3136632 RepID=UPI003872C6BE
MPFFRPLLAAIALQCAAAGAIAQVHDGHDHAAPPAAAPQAQEWSDGVVTRWDARTGKVTIRHGEIKPLSMPPMTMVFTLEDPAQGAALKPGDAVRFQARDAGGALVVTRIEAVR